VITIKNCIFATAGSGQKTWEMEFKKDCIRMNKDDVSFNCLKVNEEFE
jgi:hypothetical protein